MAINLIYETESPRGAVRLVADLSGLDTYEAGEEIRRFFVLISSIKCRIYDIEDADAKLRQIPGKEESLALRLARDDQIEEETGISPILEGLSPVMVV